MTAAAGSEMWLARNLQQKGPDNIWGMYSFFSAGFLLSDVFTSADFMKIFLSSLETSDTNVLFHNLQRMFIIKAFFFRRKLLQQSKPDSRVAYNGFGWGQWPYIKDRMKLETGIKIRWESLQQTLNK